MIDYDQLIYGKNTNEAVQADVLGFKKGASPKAQRVICLRIYTPTFGPILQTNCYTTSVEFFELSKGQIYVLTENAQVVLGQGSMKL